MRRRSNLHIILLACAAATPAVNMPMRRIAFVIQPDFTQKSPMDADHENFLATRGIFLLVAGIFGSPGRV
jgi:hypothetical protein